MQQPWQPYSNKNHNNSQVVMAMCSGQAYLDWTFAYKSLALICTKHELGVPDMKFRNVCLQKSNRNHSSKKFPELILNSFVHEQN